MLKVPELPAFESRYGNFIILGREFDPLFFLSTLFFKMFCLSTLFLGQITTPCTPIDDLIFCRNELESVSETIRFLSLENPTYAHLFEVDGIPVADTLERLTKQLEFNFNDCPCINTCTELEYCDMDHE